MLLIDQKINKIENELKEILNQVEINKTTEKISSLKDKVLGWIGIINQQETYQQPTQFKKVLDQ